MKKIYSIVLVAGLSSRMGKFKPLLPYKGTTIISYLIQELLKTNVNGIIVVTGHNTNSINNELKKYNINIVFNDCYQKGMHTSVICGVKHLPEDTDSFMINLGDQPHISKDLINNLINYSNNSKKGIILPSYSKKRGHPIILDKKYINECLKLDEKQGLKKVIISNESDIDYYNVSKDDILLDIDTPEDYNKLLDKTETQA